MPTKKNNPLWIARAIKHPGKLRMKAKRKGLIKGDEKLSMSDIKKLEHQGGKTAKEAHLAETLMKFHKYADGGELNMPIPMDRLQELARVVGGKLWQKADKIRIYVNGGNNYHYQGKWWYEIEEDGAWQTKCWLDGGYYNKKREDYVDKHLMMMDDEMQQAIEELNNE